MTILLAILFTNLSLAAEKSFPVDAIKLADGKVAYCGTQKDVGSLGYRPTLPVVVSEEKSVKISFNVLGLVCNSTEEGFAWNLRPINDPFSTKALNGDPVENFVVENEAVLASFGYTKELGKQALANQSVQAVEVNVNLADVLSAPQLKALDEGHAVAVRVVYFQRFITEYAYRGQRHRGRLFAGGSYSFAFTLVKVDGTIHSTAATIL